MTISLISSALSLAAMFFFWWRAREWRRTALSAWLVAEVIGDASEAKDCLLRSKDEVIEALEHQLEAERIVADYGMGEVGATNDCAFGEWIDWTDND